MSKRYSYTVTFTDYYLVASYKTIAGSRPAAVRDALRQHKQRHGRLGDTSFNVITITLGGEVK
jgi:hypothetical protein